MFKFLIGNDLVSLNQSGFETWRLLYKSVFVYNLQHLQIL